MSISVKELTKKYKEQKAVDSISFEVESGEIVGFLGPNGAGKSTTMKMLTGYVSPSSGKAEVCGLPVDQNTKETKKKIGYLPEHNPLYLDMYVKEYLSYVARLSGLKGSVNIQVEEVIKRTGLEREKNKKLQALSKGYRQRVGLAQALIHEPEVLILDEPTSGLDPNQIIEIRNLIKEVGKSKTVLLSTHIMQEVEAMCDRVIIINRGKLVLNKPIEELRSSARSKKLVVRFKNKVEPDGLKKALGDVRVATLETGELEIQYSGEDISEALFHFAVKQKNAIIEQKASGNNLEQVFRDLTRG
jgi:ABC-2 type transport system ATP-binding protein